jgi:hypothetical protein
VTERIGHDFLLVSEANVAIRAMMEVKSLKIPNWWVNIRIPSSFTTRRASLKYIAISLSFISSMFSSKYPCSNLVFNSVRRWALRYVVILTLMVSGLAKGDSVQNFLIDVIHHRCDKLPDKQLDQHFGINISFFEAPLQLLLVFN